MDDWKAIIAAMEKGEMPKFNDKPSTAPANKGGGGGRDKEENRLVM